MKLKLIFLVLILSISAAFSQSNKEIKIIVFSKAVSDSQTVYITGNHSAIGNWDPGVISLTKERDDKWIGTFSLPEGFHLEYKLTLGSWEKEALDTNGNVPTNNTLKVVNDTTIIISVKSWKHQVSRGITGQITGTVKYHENLKWKGIRDRDVVVWLPPGYNKNTDERYPVLYMHDGQNMFDTRTSAFGVDWQIDEAADSLISKNYIKPIIIVGIYNTPDRSYEYTPGLSGYAYMNFIVNKLKPFIDSTYRTLPDRENTSTGGSSLGGLISFMLVWIHSDVFSQAACISPAFKIGKIDFVSPVKRYIGKKKQIRIYIDNGSVELEDSLQSGIDEMLFALQEKGYVEGEDLYYYKALGAKHFESDWAERIWRPLIFMFGNENSYQYIDEK
jgi:predicted alpha/beta superfamily hydrolase